MSRSLPSSDYDDVLTRGQRWRRWWTRPRIAVAISLALVPVGWLAARPFYRSYRQAQAEKLIGQATEAARRGESDVENELIRRAATLGMGSPTLMRSMAAHFTETEDPRALMMYRSLVEGGAAGEEDRARLVELAIKWRQPGLARDEVETRLKDAKTASSVRWTALCAGWLALDNQWPRAIATLAAARGQSGAAPAELDLAEARLLADRATAVGGASSDEARRGLALLRQALQSAGGAVRLDAARYFATQLLRSTALRPLAERSDAEAVLREIDAAVPKAGGDPDAGDELRLTAAALRILIDPGAQSAEIDTLRAFFQPLADRRQLAFARWLVRFRFLDEALAWIGPDAARLSDETWLLTKLDALAGAGKWEEVEAALRQRAGGGLPKTTAALYVLRAGLARQVEAAELILRRRSLDSALDVAPPSEIFYVAWNLDESGHPDLALPVYRRLEKSAQLAIAGALGVVRCLARDPAQTAELRAALAKLISLQPDSNEARNDFHYLSLLTGEDAAAAAEGARELAARQPEFLAMRTTAALAELLEGRPADALRAYGGVEVNWAALPAHWRAVRASVLAANGRGVEAAQLAQGIDRAQLRREEAALLDRFVK